MMETVHVEDAAVRDGIQIEDPHAVASDTSTVVAHRPSWTTLLAIFVSICTQFSLHVRNMC